MFRKWKLVGLLWVILVAAAVAFPTTIAAQATPKNGTEQVEVEDGTVGEAIASGVAEQTDRKMDAKEEELIAEATAALEQTREAIRALDEGDTKAALDALSLATGKLELVIAREPNLAMAPVEVGLVRREIIGSIDTIRDTRYAIEDLIDAGELQRARPLLRDFASEIVVETTNIPLATYPDAIKLASAQIDDGKLEEAKTTLATALSTLVITEDVVPLPLARAELLMLEAKVAIEAQKTPSERTASTEPDAQAAEGASPADEAVTPKTYIEAARGSWSLQSCSAMAADRRLRICGGNCASSSVSSMRRKTPAASLTRSVIASKRYTSVCSENGIMTNRRKPLKSLNLERFLIGQMIPSDRKAL